MDGRVEVVRQGATRLLTRVRKHRFALLGLTAYIVVLSSYSIYRYFNGQADAWDLGIMQQSLYTFAFDGRLFYYTPELFVKNPSGSFWGIHFSLLIIPLSAYYRLFPSGISLLVLQSVIVAAAAIPLRRICAELGSPDGNWIAALYLLSPMTVLSAFYDFHLEAFIPLGVFTLVLALLRRNYLWVAVAAGTTLSIYEYGAFFVAASVLFVAALHYRALPRLLTDASSWSRSTRQIVLAGAALVLLSAAYFVGAQYIIHSINPVTAQLNGSYTPEPISVGTLLPGLEFDWSSKLIFFAVPLLVLGLIPFFDPRGLVIALPFSFIALFGTADYAEFGYQYGFLILPGIILSLALGLIWLRRHRLGLRIIPWLRPVMLTVSVVSIAVIVILGT
ncbi:MAG: DUF2079 domain-containing protein, partial [Thermoplasmata archaeon]|nr:DUF2079 domain-containing protein [Thermoplasmata archaeon]